MIPQSHSAALSSMDKFSVCPVVWKVDAGADVTIPTDATPVGFVKFESGGISLEVRDEANSTANLVSDKSFIGLLARHFAQHANPHPNAKYSAAVRVPIVGERYLRWVKSHHLAGLSEVFYEGINDIVDPLFYNSQVFARTSAAKSNPVAEHIKQVAALFEAEDLNAREVLNHATTDALLVLEREGISQYSAIDIDDNGFLTLHWTRGDDGVALSFAGDGCVTVATREKGLGFAENYVEQALETLLPSDVIRFFRNEA